MFAPNEARFAKYALMRRAGTILFDPALEASAQHRTCWCHRGVANASDSVAIYRTTSGDNARMHGVTTCKSVWTCPACSAKICAVRQAELQQGMKNWIGQGGYVFLMTLTFPHDRGERLAELLPTITAQGYFEQSQGNAAILKYVPFSFSQGAAGKFTLPLSMRGAMLKRLWLYYTGTNWTSTVNGNLSRLEAKKNGLVFFDQMDLDAQYLSPRHARHARKRGNGDRNEGIRILIEEDEERQREFVERRAGLKDRRKK